MLSLSPDIRRLVIQYAAKEGLAFEVALECIVLEGVKALADAGAGFTPAFCRGQYRG